MFQNRQVRLIVEDSVKDVRGIADRCRNHLRPVLGELITGPRVKGNALAIAEVLGQRHRVADLPPDGKPLPIRRRQRSASPMVGQGLFILNWLRVLQLPLTSCSL